jgi:phasin family protein
MATASQNFMGMDLPKFADFTKIAEQFKVPGVDADTLIDYQRKNIEAFSAVQQIALEGAQAVGRRQVELLRQLIDESAGAVKELTAVGKPEDKLAKQTELFKQGFEQSLANLRELAEMGAKSNGEAAELINQRITEGLEEIKTAIEKVAAGK